MGCGGWWPLCARALFRGGNAHYGSKAGFGYVNVNNTVGNSNTNIGGRLSTSI